MDETLQCEDLRKNMNCENAPRCLEKDTSYLLIHRCTPICTRKLVKGGGLWNQGTYNALGTSQQKTTYIHAKCLWTFYVSSSFNSWNRLSIKHHSHFKTTSSQGSLKLIWTSLFLKPIFTPNRSRLTVLTVFQMQKHVYHEASRWLLFGYGWAKSLSQRGGGESKSVAIWVLGVVEDAQVWWLHHLLSALVGRSIG